MNKGRIDATPLVTSTLPFWDAVTAFNLAGDRSRATKVHLRFAETSGTFTGR